MILNIPTSEGKSVRMFADMEWYEKELVKDVREVYNTSLTDEELVSLYSQYSEKEWSANWEDNVEGLFIEWLKEKENKSD